MERTRISRAQGAKAEAINHILSHGDDVKIGDTIRYAAADGRDSWTDSATIITAHDLRDASMLRAGTAVAPAGAYQGKTAIVVNRAERAEVA
jgi:hypothetical protein